MSGGGILFDGLCWTQVSITPGAIALSSTVDVSVTLPGALSTDFIMNVTKPTLTSGVDIGNARMTANNTMKITFQNSTSAQITPATETYTICLARPSNVLGGPDALSGGVVIFK